MRHAPPDSPLDVPGRGQASGPCTEQPSLVLELTAIRHVLNGCSGEPSQSSLEVITVVAAGYLEGTEMRLLKPRFPPLR